MKPFKPEHYFVASLERIRQARLQYQSGSGYALTMYLSGLAVECMLRAFKGKRTKTLDERHDLGRLFRTSGYERQQEAGAAPRQELAEAIDRICRLWSNDFRYASEDRMRAYLKKDPVLRLGIKGDMLKAWAHQLLEAAQRVVNSGTLQWQSSKRPGSS